MSETAGTITATEEQGSETLRHVLLLLALACLLFFLGLGTLGLTDQDEGRNAGAGREMVESGNYVSPTFNYEPRFAKPAMLYWIMSASYHMFGINEFAARFPSALFGVGFILLQYLFLKRVVGHAIGLLASLMLLLNIEIVAIGRTVITDSVLIFFTTLSLFCFWLGLHGTRHERHYMWGFYIGIALGTLTKGPIGLLVPMIGVIPYLFFSHRWKQYWSRGFPILGTLLMLLLAVPWYAVMLNIHGAAYTTSASADTIGRFLNIIGGHGGTILFYFPVVALGFFPWSALLPMALHQTYRGWQFWRQEWKLGGVDRKPAPREFEFFAASWFVFGFIFFSLSATRLPHYIGPLFPAAAIVAGAYLHRCLTNATTPGLRLSIRMMMGLGYLLGLAFSAGPALYTTFIDQVIKEFPYGNQIDPGPAPIMGGAVLLIGSGLIGYFGLSEARRAGLVWVAGTTIGFFMLLAIQIGLPHFHTYFIAPPQELAFIAGENLGPQDHFVKYGREKASVVFYARRKTVFIKPGQEDRLVDILQQPGRTMILLPERLKDQLPIEAQGLTVLLKRYGYLLMANEPMVDIPPEPQGPKVPPPSFHNLP